MSPDTDVTRLLLEWSDGKEAAAAPLMDAVYDELPACCARLPVERAPGPFTAGHGAGP